MADTDRGDAPTTLASEPWLIRDRDLLLALYQKTVDEQQWHLEAHQNRVAFYTSLASAIVAGTVAGAFQAKTTTDYVLLLTGPFLLAVLAFIGNAATGRFYSRFLEAVATRAKLESVLGLDVPWPRDGAWKDEPIVPTRHISDRAHYRSSLDFVEERRTQGYQRHTGWLFRAIGALSILIAAFLAFRTLAPDT